MSYASFEHPKSGQAGFGRVEGNQILDLSDSAADLKSALGNGGLEHCVGHTRHALSDITLQPVIPNPGKIFCVGHNYETHRQETGRAKVDYPSIFTRWTDTLVAHGQPIVCPHISSSLDYEAELAVVIGKAGRYIPEEDALEYVAGYSCFNDASVRDWQWHTNQFTPGKNFPSTGALGPYLVTPDECGDLSRSHVISRLNGQVMQDQPVSDMIFSISRIIAYVSSFTPLSAGDVIATGTPGGVGAKRQPPVWMKPGDQIEIEVEGVGKLLNQVIAES
jgi:2-keto-4-pentenoate hydratase/2-oxohepta-3-ene-1,7-dioic acid hydratase in catechol pathway